MSRTAWTSRASSVPSDRIPPSNVPPITRNKGKAKVHDLAKSKEILKLEEMVEGLKLLSNRKDPKGGCFCKARLHPLSKYTPLCMECGFIICALHAPYYSCPHCASPLLTPASRDSLVETISTEISEVLIREREQHERDLQERQKAAGAFPILASNAGITQDTVSNQSRKVLSLNAQTRKITVASYAVNPPVSHVSSGKEKPEDVRVPPPPRDIDFVKGKTAEDARWENLRIERINYVHLPSQTS